MDPQPVLVETMETIEGLSTPSRRPSCHRDRLESCIEVKEVDASHRKDKG